MSERWSYFKRNDAAVRFVSLMKSDDAVGGSRIDRQELIPSSEDKMSCRRGGERRGLVAPLSWTKLLECPDGVLRCPQLEAVLSLIAF